MIPFKSILITAFAIVCVSAGVLHARDTVRVLIITGQNNHDWARSTPMIESLLEETGRFTVTVSTTPSEEAPEDAWNAWRPDFSRHDVVLSDYNGKMWPESVKTGFVTYVSGGGGVVLVHAANNAFGGWKEFEDMTGLLWRDSGYGDRLYLDGDLKLVRSPKGDGPGAGHGDSHAYQITSREKDHPILKGMPEVWMHVSDELYHGQRGPAKDMHILATAFSSRESKGTGVHEPMVWWIPAGKGKVVTLVPGHLGKGQGRPSAYDCVGFRTLLQRSTEWAATGKVTIPVPENFPTVSDISTVP